MFGLLKNKLASFIKGLSGKEEQKAAETLPAGEKKPEITEEEKPIGQKKPVEAKTITKAEPKIEKKEALKQKAEGKEEAPKIEKKAEPAPKPVGKKAEPKPEEKPAAKPVEEKKPSSTAEAVPLSAQQKGAQSPGTPGDSRGEQSTDSNSGSSGPLVGAPTSRSKSSTQEPIPVAASPMPVEAPKKSFIGSIFGKPAPKAEVKMAPKPIETKPEPKPAAPPVARQPEPEMPKQPERDFSQLARKATSTSDKKDIAPKIGIGTTLRSIFSSEITIGEGEVTDLLSELELSLLEADVAYDVSLDVSSQLRSRLVGMKVPKGKVEERTREAIQEVLASVMTSDRKFDLIERVRGLVKPAKILFVGPNGAGKTTTMAKIAHMLLQNGLTCVFSASDTFRAAAIEQTEVHAGRLGVKVVKSKYGADPASVAFEAVSFARAHGIDVVLIDSAGRQDTNANLLDELKKIDRVAKPDIKIYIGESIGGNSLIDQVRAFDEAIGMDGAILTKIDCDAKGGTALSLTKSTNIPIIYLGIGQAYTDLIPFEPGKIAQEIMS